MVDKNYDNDGGFDEQTRFGDYEIVKPIGKGKFAVVYRARRVDNNDIVALKRINVDLIDNKARDKCLKEVNLLQSLDHPNIIRYLDSFITDHDLVIVVEWAAAGDLKRQLRKAQEKNIGFEERIIWKYFSQICDAIQHMHDKRIMHRDLKPANIFLTLDGTIKVGDLGLSRELSEHTIQAHSKVGTPLYMSPEVLKGDGYDFKSDIWSLGCLLYELAVLKSPFKSEGLKLYALFQKISQGDYQPITEEYSQELRSLAYSLISTNPEDRPDISNVCDIARTMRYNTQELYLKQKREKQEITETNHSDSEASAIFPHLNRNIQQNVNNNQPEITLRNSNPIPVKSFTVHDDKDILDDNIIDHNNNTENDNDNYDDTIKFNNNTKYNKSNKNKQINKSVVSQNNDNNTNNYTNDNITDSSAYSLMDNIYSKLIILEYPMIDLNTRKSTLLPFHFAINLSAMKSIAGINKGDQKNQFFKFVEVVIWIYSKFNSNIIKDKVKLINIYNDPSITIAKQLLGLTETIGMEGSTISDITPASLISGHGLKVCNFLVSLIDYTIKYFQIQPQKLKYELYEDNQLAVNDDDDEDILDENNMNIDDDIKYDSSIDISNNGIDKSYSNDNIFGNSMIISNIDPKLWYEEVERVTSKLSNDKTTTGLSDGWIGRLVSISKQKRNLDISIDPPLNSEITSVLEIGNVSKNISNSIQSLIRIENLLNSNHNYSKFKNDFLIHQKELETLKGQSIELTKRIENLSLVFTDVEDKLGEIKEQYDNKTSNENDLNGSSRLQQVKASILRIKNEITSINISFGMKSSLLLQLKQNKAYDKRKQLYYKNKKRNNKNKPTNKYDYDDDNSDGGLD